MEYPRGLRKRVIRIEEEALGGESRAIAYAAVPRIEH